MAHEGFFEGAPVSAKAQTEADATGNPCRGKYGQPITKEDFMEFVEKRETGGDAPPTAAVDSASASGHTLRDAVRAALLRAGMTQERIARHAGVSGSTLSQWLNGKYTGDNTALERRIASWVAEPQNKFDDHCGPIPTWVQTPTAQAIEGALNYARSRPSIAVVYGGAGVGKTTAIWRYARDSKDVWIFEASKSRASMLEALRAVYELMTGYKCEEKRSSTISRMILERLQWWCRDRGLLVVDEAQHLTIDAIEEFRALHDSAGIGLVLAGNESVYAQLTGRTRRAEFAQLFSRVGKRLRLDKPTAEDVLAILQAWRVEGAKEREFCQQIASMPGGLRGLTNVLVDATAAAQAMGRLVDLKMLRAAWGDLGAMQ